jgi:hypothetical protein
VSLLSRSAASLVVAVAAAAVPAAHAQTGELRLDPPQVAALPVVASGGGTSGVQGIETRLLNGDPARPGPYTIAIRVPPNTRIAAHTHRDNRTAVVASGLWHLGYGAAASTEQTRALPPGSFYTEPAGDAHFAWTGPEGATVYITGTGPSDTQYRPSTGQNPH